MSYTRVKSKCTCTFVKLGNQYINPYFIIDRFQNLNLKEIFHVQCEFHGPCTLFESFSVRSFLTFFLFIFFFLVVIFFWWLFISLNYLTFISLTAHLEFSCVTERQMTYAQFFGNQLFVHSSIIQSCCCTQRMVRKLA